MEDGTQSVDLTEIYNYLDEISEKLDSIEKDNENNENEEKNVSEIFYKSFFGSALPASSEEITVDYITLYNQKYNDNLVLGAVNCVLLGLLAGLLIVHYFRR